MVVMNPRPLNPNPKPYKDCHDGGHDDCHRLALFYGHCSGLSSADSYVRTDGHQQLRHMYTPNILHMSKAASLALLLAWWLRRLHSAKLACLKAAL